MKRNLFPVTLILLCGVSSSLGTAYAQALPDDIQLLHALQEELGDERSLDSESAKTWSRVLLEQGLQQVDELTQQRGYPEWISSNHPPVREELEQLLSEALPAASTSREELLLVSASVFSGWISENAVSRALGFGDLPDPGSGAVRSLKRQAIVVGGGNLSMDLDTSVLSEESPGMGAQNGIWDPGEQVNLKLSFLNKGPRRLMSTSVYLQELSRCLWSTTDFEEELQLAEINPGERASVSISVYLSRECGPGPHQIKLQASDTHEFAARPLNFTLSFATPAAALREAQVDNFILDLDDAGHSEPGEQMIHAGERVEVSSDLVFKGLDVAEGRQEYRSTAFWTAAKHVPQTSSPDNQRWKQSRLSRVDDLDLVAKGPKAYDAAILEAVEPRSWKLDRRALVPIAVDTWLYERALKTGTTEQVLVFDEAKVLAAVQDYCSDDICEEDAEQRKKQLLQKLAQAGSMRDLIQPGEDRPPRYYLRHYLDIPVEDPPHQPVPVHCALEVLELEKRKSQVQMTISGATRTDQVDVQVTERSLLPGFPDRQFELSTTAKDQQQQFILPLELSALAGFNASLSVRREGEEVCQAKIGKASTDNTVSTVSRTEETDADSLRFQSFGLETGVRNTAELSTRPSLRFVWGPVLLGATPYSFELGTRAEQSLGYRQNFDSKREHLWWALQAELGTVGLGDGWSLESAEYTAHSHLLLNWQPTQNVGLGLELGASHQEGFIRTEAGLFLRTGRAAKGGNP